MPGFSLLLNDYITYQSPETHVRKQKYRLHSENKPPDNTHFTCYRNKELNTEIGEDSCVALYTHYNEMKEYLIKQSSLFPLYFLP